MTNLERERDNARRRVLGWGIACEEIFPGLDVGRDIRLTAGPNGTDLALVEGMSNLGQDLSLALTTLLGSDVFNVRFGFDGLNALVEETDPVLVRERVRIGVIKVLRDDPRITRLVDVKLIDSRLTAGRAPADEAEIVEPALPAARQLQVRVAFETAAGDQAAVDLGRIAPNG